MRFFCREANLQVWRHSCETRSDISHVCPLLTLPSEQTRGPWDLQPWPLYSSPFIASMIRSTTTASVPHPFGNVFSPWRIQPRRVPVMYSVPVHSVRCSVSDIFLSSRVPSVSCSFRHVFRQWRVHFITCSVSDAFIPSRVPSVTCLFRHVFHQWRVHSVTFSISYVSIPPRVPSVTCSFRHLFRQWRVHLSGIPSVTCSFPHVFCHETCPARDVICPWCAPPTTCQTHLELLIFPSHVERPLGRGVRVLHVPDAHGGAFGRRDASTRVENIAAPLEHTENLGNTNQPIRIDTGEMRYFAVRSPTTNYC